MRGFPEYPSTENSPEREPAKEPLKLESELKERFRWFERETPGIATAQEWEVIREFIKDGRGRDNLYTETLLNALTSLEERLSKRSSSDQEVGSESADSGMIDEMVRRLRFSRALESVYARFPGAIEQVRRSLRTPQLGAYHCEGPTMESHLRAVLAALDVTAQGKFPAALDSFVDTRTLLQTAAGEPDPENPGKTRVRQDMTDYVFFHDISKPDCMTLGFAAGEDVEITWEQWQEIVAGGEPYTYHKGEKDAREIVKISYFHGSRGSDGNHGNVGAELLKDAPGISADVLVAMANHEVAYQFPKISAAAYEKHFVRPGFTELQQAFILLVSYIDTSGSFRQNGEPDYSNFLYVIQSRQNYQLIEKALKSGAKFDQRKLAELQKRDAVITVADLDAALIKEKQYDVARLEAGLEALVATGQLTSEERETVLDLIRTGHAGELGKRLGRRMVVLRPILAQAEQEGV